MPQQEGKIGLQVEQATSNEGQGRRVAGKTGKCARTEIGELENMNGKQEVTKKDAAPSSGWEGTFVRKQSRFTSERSLKARTKFIRQGPRTFAGQGGDLS